MLTAFGSFNPRIFHPHWLLEQRLLRSSDLQLALPSMVATPTSISFHGQDLLVEVSLDRLILRTTQRSNFDRVRSIAARIFRLLPHTPVQLVGFTRDQEYSFGGGNSLGAFMEIIGLRNVLDVPPESLTNWEVNLSFDWQDPEIERTVFVERSNENNFGVYLGVVDKFQFSENESKYRADAARLAVEQRWELLANTAESVLQKVVEGNQLRNVGRKSDALH